MLTSPPASFSHGGRARFFRAEDAHHGLGAGRVDHRPGNDQSGTNWSQAVAPRPPGEGTPQPQLAEFRQLVAPRPRARGGTKFDSGSNLDLSSSPARAWRDSQRSMAAARLAKLKHGTNRPLWKIYPSGKTKPAMRRQSGRLWGSGWRVAAMVPGEFGVWLTGCR